MLRIKELREVQGLSVNELADRSGVSERMLRNYENGGSDITLSKLLQIAKALNVNFWELVKEDDEFSDLPFSTNSNTEKEISNSLDSLPLEVQNKILKGYLFEKNKIIASLQKVKIEAIGKDISNLGNTFSVLEEYVLEAISLMVAENERERFKKLLEDLKEKKAKTSASNQG